MQAYAVRDWIIKQGIVGASEIDLAIQSDVSMRMCRDICNRYKHYVISKPSIDAEWSIQRRLVNPFAGDEWEWTVMAANHNTLLWDLMIACIGFWEALVAAYGLEMPCHPDT
jgi:hypothetical protein